MSNYSYWSNIYKYGHKSPNSYYEVPYYDYSRWYYDSLNIPMRQQSIRGQASWTDGGQVTKCGIPWSHNQYMTASVGRNSPYRCGQILKIRNLSTQGGREIIVTVVDQVESYPPNKINLHRKAFEALGASTNLGVINIEIIPSPKLEEEKWGKYLLEVTQAAYKGYQVTDYQLITKKLVSPAKTQETYDFILHSPRENIRIRGTVIYNPKTEKIISFDIKEI